MSVSLVDVRTWMTRYIMSIFLAAGVLGNLTNIYIFTLKEFRRNSCSLYLLAASFVNAISVLWGLFPALYTLSNTDPSTYSYIYCKLRLYTIHTFLMIGRSLIVFACVDRYALCSQSTRLRSFCTRKTAIRVIIANFLLWPILTIHTLLFRNFDGTQCFMSGAYVLIYGLYSTMAAGIVPPTLMTIFSILTIRHRHRLGTRLNQTEKSRRRNHSLVVMLSTQVVVYVVTTSLYPAITLYRAVTNNQAKSTESLQIESFVNFIGGSFLIYLNASSVFYIYFIGSKRFRRECLVTVAIIIRKLMGRPSRVNPSRTHVHDTIHRTSHR